MLLDERSSNTIPGSIQARRGLFNFLAAFPSFHQPMFSEYPCACLVLHRLFYQEYGMHVTECNPECSS